MKLIAALILCIGCAVTTRPDEPCVAPEQNRLFCTKTSPPFPICFTLPSVSFYPHDRAVLIHGNVSRTMNDADWARLVEFGRTHGYEIPDAEQK